MWGSGLIDGGNAKLRYHSRERDEYDEVTGKRSVVVERWITGPRCQPIRVEDGSDVVIGRNRYEAVSEAGRGDPEVWKWYLQLSCENCI